MKPGIFDTDVFMTWLEDDRGEASNDAIISVLETYTVFATPYSTLGDALREVFNAAVVADIRSGECIDDAVKEGLRMVTQASGVTNAD